MTFLDGIRLRLGSIVVSMSFGCDSIDIGDFDERTSSGTGTSGASQGETGAGETAGDGQSSEGEASTSGDTTSGGETTASVDDGSGGAASIGGGIAPLCDPLAQDCPEGDTCVWNGDEFRCFERVSTAPSGSACESPNGCAVGLQCIDAESLGCSAEALGCCSSVCDASDPGSELCGQGTICTAWFDAGLAPAGLEDVGVCRIDESGASESSGTSDGDSGESSGTDSG
jgi:hypothetical protein